MSLPKESCLVGRVVVSKSDYCGRFLPLWSKSVMLDVENDNVLCVEAKANHIKWSFHHGDICHRVLDPDPLGS